MSIVNSNTVDSEEHVLLLVAAEREALARQLQRVVNDRWRLEWITSSSAVPFAGGYALFIVDVVQPQPGPDGFALCRALRKQGNQAPVVLLLSDASLDGRLAAFEATADDCLHQPFDLRELLARVNALARRSGTSEPFVLERADVVAAGSAMTNGRSIDSAIVERAAQFAQQHGLSERERQILTLVVDGVDLKAVGPEIGCAYASVRTYLRRMARKLGCSTTREIVIRFYH